MADNFLERQREEYEKRKAEWLKRRGKLPKPAKKRESKGQPPV